MQYKKKLKILFNGEATFASTGYGRIGYELLSRLHASGKYRIAELGSFAECGDPRDHIIKWRYYPNQVNDKDSRWQQFCSNETNKTNAWRFDKVLLDFQPDIVCFTPGSLVFTNTGYKPIESIKIGEMVYTHKGRFRKVLKLLKHEYNGKLIKIQSTGLKNYLKLTPEHPVLVYKQPDYTYKNQSWKDTYKDIDPQFISASEIKTGYKTVFPILQSDNTVVSTLDIRQYLTNYKILNNKIYTTCHKQFINGINYIININENFAELIGTIIGDGYINKSGLSITFHSKESRFFNRIKDIITSIFEIPVSLKKEVNKNAVTLRVNSRILSEFLTNFLSKDKSSIDFNYFGTIPLIKSLIKGMVRSDGCYKKNTVSFTNTNPKIAHLFKSLTSLIGIPTNLQIKSVRTKVNQKICKSFDIEGYGTSAESLHQICQKHDNIIGNKNSNNRKTQLVNNYIISSVKRIRKDAEYHGQVYNLEVEEDNSYCVEQYCVHNCEIRDTTMFSYIPLSPLRKFFYWIASPSVDSAPQVNEWISTLMNCDQVIGYGQFGMDTLERESGGKIKLFKPAYPSVNFDIFHPIKNKSALRQTHGISADANIVGFCARNQIRKLIPALMRGFRVFLTQMETIDPYGEYLLYLNTTHPDLMQWDLNKLLVEYKLTNNVLFTYYCTQCGRFFPNKFQDILTTCRYCQRVGAILPRVNHMIPPEYLNEVYNLMDLYVQYVNCEAAGMPLIEAAGAGVPVMGINYSGVSDIIRRLEGVHLKYYTLARDIRVNADRAVPNEEHLVEELIRFFKRPKQINLRQGIKTHELCKIKFNWDEYANIWMEAIDNAKLTGTQGKWHSKLYYQAQQVNENQCLADYTYDLLRMGLQEYHLTSNMIFDSYIKNAENGMVTTGNGVSVINKEGLKSMLNGLINNKIQIENIRCGQAHLLPEDFYQYAENKELANL